LPKKLIMHFRITFCIFLFLTQLLNINAQDQFEFNPSSFDEEYIEDEISFEYIMGGAMTNLSSQELMIDWEFIEIDLPSAWDKYVVDINFSYPPSINSSPIPLVFEPKVADQYFGVNIWPNEQAGCGTLKVVFTDHLDSTVIDTVEYSISINNPGCVTTSTSSFSSQDYNISPNPSNGVINLSTTEDITFIEVYSLSGQLVHQINQIQNPSIDLSHFSKGVYILKILDKFGQNHISKLVKE